MNVIMSITTASDYFSNCIPEVFFPLVYLRIANVCLGQAGERSIQSLVWIVDRWRFFPAKPVSYYIDNPAQHLAVVGLGMSWEDGERRVECVS